MRSACIIHSYSIKWSHRNTLHKILKNKNASSKDLEINTLIQNKRDVFYVRRVVDLMKAAKVNAYIMFIFGKIKFVSIHAT